MNEEELLRKIAEAYNNTGYRSLDGREVHTAMLLFKAGYLTMDENGVLWHDKEKEEDC